MTIFLPGWCQESSVRAGGSRDSYVQYTLKAARELGIRGIVFNYRGVADSPVVTPKLYSASHTGDFRLLQDQQTLSDYKHAACLPPKPVTSLGSFCPSWLGDGGFSLLLVALPSL